MTTADPQLALPNIAVKPETLHLLSSIAGLGSLVRDQDLRIRWCDRAYAAYWESDPSELLGTTLRDLLPSPTAEEREAIIAEVIRTDESTSFVQFGADRRLVCRVVPIDRVAFGYTGALCMIMEAPLIAPRSESETLRVLKFPHLSVLSVLTNAELRTLYDLACGNSNTMTAERQFRSVRTIENHVEAIHRKLGTPTRSALVRFATERGVQGFTADEWDTIVEGAGESRKAAAAFSRRAAAPLPGGNRN